MADECARREVGRITALPLVDPPALYRCLPSKLNPSRYIKEDIELRQMLGRAEKHMSRERAAALVKQVTESLDARLLAAASPHINSHYGLLPGGHGRSERAKSRRWAGALARVIQAASPALAAMLLRYFDP